MFGEIVHNAGKKRSHNSHCISGGADQGSGQGLISPDLFIIQASMMMVQLVHSARVEEGRLGEAESRIIPPPLGRAQSLYAS